MKLKTALITCLLVMFAATSAFAATQCAKDAESDDYGTKLGGMLARGVLNVGGGPSDLVKDTVKYTKEGPAVLGTMKGMGVGAYHMAVRMGSGLIDIATSWVPNYNGEPVDPATPLDEKMEEQGS